MNLPIVIAHIIRDKLEKAGTRLGHRSLADRLSWLPVKARNLALLLAKGLSLLEGFNKWSKQILQLISNFKMLMEVLQ